MKISPSRNYKRPLYALGVAAAAALVTMSVTACGPFYSGGMETGINETEETTGVKTKAPSKPEGGDDVRLEGEVVEIDPSETDELMIDGDVSVVETTFDDLLCEGEAMPED